MNSRLLKANNQCLHFIGIGGAGMSGLANILLSLNFTVSGSDIHRTSVIDALVERGAKFFPNHDASNITPDVSVVVYSNAIPESNPEILAAKKYGIPIIARAELLQNITSAYRSIGVTGTHGKTTTTSMIAHLLEHGQLNPSLILGGSSQAFNKNSYLRESEFFIYEACEAFASIDYLSSEIAVMTNIDNDHMDFYKNMHNLLQAFIRYLNKTPFYGIIILNADDPYTKQILPHIHKNYILCGFSHTNGVYADHIVSSGFQSSFDLFYKNQKVDRVTLNMPGKHNIHNALLASAVALYLEIPISVIKEALLSFSSPTRRFQSYGQYKGAYIIDDYAHHPTEISATIHTAKKIQQDLPNIQRLIIIFQPHLYSRTEEHLKAFALALSEADMVILGPIYAAREKNIHHISSQHLEDEFKLIGFDHCFVAEDFPDILRHVKLVIQENDLVITMGAGNIYEIAQQLIKEEHE